MGYDCYGSYLTSLRCSKAFWEGGGGGGGGVVCTQAIRGLKALVISFLSYCMRAIIMHTQSFHRLLHARNTYVMGTFIAICC